MAGVLVAVCAFVDVSARGAVTSETGVARTVVAASRVCASRISMTAVPDKLSVQYSAARAVRLFQGVRAPFCSVEEVSTFGRGLRGSKVRMPEFVSVYLWLSFAAIWPPIFWTLCLRIIVVRIAARCFLHETARCRLE